MTSTLVIYGSNYGYTRTYAEWIAEDTHGRAVAADQVGAAEVDAADVVVIGASDYAGKLTAADRIRDLAANLREKKVAYFTVSFSGDVSQPSEKLDGVLAKNLGEAYHDGAPTGHFRGGMDYSQLSRAHKTAMMGVRTFLKSKPNKSETDLQMIECYGGSADYRDRASIAPLVSAIKAL
ncbi:flavodoxin [Kocuria koreensis]|jgi:menaquinone-dependent protoporphyrinogen IX oxidase|uniref:Flavodoxin n=1 Tax=Rothia koreensis TaxID=592378 RepID=A0A7K1LHT0_9MICC|nr:flavodoxin domain-containing protein [Rothia koreensis]MUN54736.1 flavodoxin [Rothia koreensis]